MLSTRCSVHVVTKSLTYYNNNKCPAKVNLKVNKFSTFGGYSGVESFLKCKIGHNIATKIVLIENVFGDQIKGEVFNSFAAVVIHYGLVMMYKIVHGLVVIPTSFIRYSWPMAIALNSWYNLLESVHSVTVTFLPQLCLGMAYQHTLSNHHQLNASNPSWQNFAPRRAEKGANEIFVTMGVNGEFLHFGGF